MMKPMMNMMVDYCFIVTIRTCNDLAMICNLKTPENRTCRFVGHLNLTQMDYQSIPNKGNMIYLSILGIVLSMGNTHFGLSMDYQSIVLSMGNTRFWFEYGLSVHCSIDGDGLSVHSKENILFFLLSCCFSCCFNGITTY